VHRTMKTMKKYLIAALFAIAALCFPALSLAQQNLLIQTTLTGNVPIPTQLANPPQAYGFIPLASTTSLVGYQLNQTTTINQQNAWVLYVDREEMLVNQVNGLTAIVTRGYNSTVATSHASGAMVLYGRAAWFYNYDPGAVLSQGGPGVPGGLVCTVAGQFAFPWVNIRNGEQWACSPTSLTYVPWFGNSNNPTQSVDFGTAASIAGAQPILGPLFRLSGTAAITSFTVPVGMNATIVGGAQFCIVPTAAFTTTATNNIASASTAVAGKTLCFTWDAATAKFNSSY